MDAALYAGGGSEGDGVGRDALVHNGVRPDDHVVADGDAGEDGAVGADPHVAADLDALSAAGKAATLARLLRVIDGGDDAPRRDHRVVADLDGRGIDERHVRVDEHVVADEDVLPADEADRLKEVEVLANSAEHGAQEDDLLVFALPSSIVDAVKLAPHVLALLEPTGVFQAEGSGLGGHGWGPFGLGMLQLVLPQALFLARVLFFSQSEHRCEQRSNNEGNPF